LDYSAQFTSLGFGLKMNREGSNSSSGAWSFIDFSLESFSSNITFGFPIRHDLSERSREIKDELTVYGNFNLSF